MTNIYLKKIYKKLPAKKAKNVLKLHQIITMPIKRLRAIPKNLIASIKHRNIKNNKIRNFEDYEQTFYSQNGEDGIIKAIFEKIGITNKFCVEFGIQEKEGNSIYLQKQGWNCLWMDGNGDDIKIKKEYITRENINELFKKFNVPKEPDLLSIDIDSNEYWIWEAIQGYSPRVVIIEYNASIPITESKTIKYDPEFQWDGSNYFGASLLALNKVGEKKGYKLITCDKKGVNAFFVKKELIGNNFEEKTIEEIYIEPKYGIKKKGKHIGHPKSEKLMITV